MRFLVRHRRIHFHGLGLTSASVEYAPWVAYKTIAFMLGRTTLDPSADDEALVPNTSSQGDNKKSSQLLSKVRKGLGKARSEL